MQRLERSLEEYHEMLLNHPRQHSLFFSCLSVLQALYTNTAAEWDYSQKTKGPSDSPSSSLDLAW